jgi:zinc transporter, ZIP family
MNDSYILLLLAAVAGFSTLIGSISIFVNKKKSTDTIVMVLGLSIGILVALGLQELLHESYEAFLEKTNVIYSILLIASFIAIGYTLTHLLDKSLHHEEDNLGHLSLITTLSITMHKLPEGMALYIAGSADIKIAIALTVAIALHHIPEGIMISMPIYYATNSKLKAILYSFLSSSATLIGAVIAIIFLNNLSTIVLGCLFSITIGMYIFVIINELLPTALSYKKYDKLIYSTLIGISLMMILHLFTH